MTDAPRVLAVVVTHNGEPWLESCLRSLADQVYPVDVIVVDNRSQVSPQAVLSQTLPEAEFVRLETNAGFGAAANHALEVSTNSRSADYFLFLHDDVVLEPEAVSLLVAMAIQTEAGIVGGKGLDWDNPEILLEIGLSADQFGYPYTGLEQGEIDQGQHDTRREALYVSNACMLASRQMIERVGLWDGGYFAFGEDLDLCIRARISGFKVLVQPGARFRHAVALAGTLRECPAAHQVRYLTRKNRPRTIAKNVAAYRMPVTLLIYTILALAEVTFLSAFRRFDEIPAYPKALWSFILSIPDVVRRRRAVQKRRTLPDRRLRRLMVKDLQRARVFLERRARDWERGTLALGKRTFAHLAPSALKATASAFLKRPSTISYAFIALVFLFAVRGSIVGGPIASGSLWPVPERTGDLLSSYTAGWRDVGLGSESAAPDLLPVVWLLGVVSFGKAVLTQKLLILGLTLIGVVGIDRAVSRRTGSVAARVAAVAIYLFGPVMQAVFEQGDLAALGLFAAAPFIISIALRIMGSAVVERGEHRDSSQGEDLGRDQVRLALVVAFAMVFGPSAIVAVAAALLLIVIQQIVVAWDRRDATRRGWRVMSSLPVAILILAPWSFEALRPSGASLKPLFSQGYAEAWSEFGLVDFLFLSPEATRLSGLLAAGLLIGALLVAGPARRRETRALTLVWFLMSGLGAAAYAGAIPTPAASPELWLMVPVACLALIASHLVAGMREELPRHAVGARHLAAGLAGITVLAGSLGSWIPGIPDWDRPRDTLAARGTPGTLADSVSSYLVTTSKDVGYFRVLWLGESWIEPVRSGVGADVPYLLTGPSGLSMLDSHEPPPSEGEISLEEAVEAMASMRLHRAGHLLATANIRFIIVDPRDETLMSSLRRQRDIALEQQQPQIATFVNLEWMPRATVAAAALEEPLKKTIDDSELMTLDLSGGTALKKRDDGFSGSLPKERASHLLLADNFNRGWRAEIGGDELPHDRAFGWANKFTLPKNASDPVIVTYGHGWIRGIWVTAHVLIVLLALSMARGAPPKKGTWAF